jgi:hypothetical protein
MTFAWAKAWEDFENVDCRLYVEDELMLSSYFERFQDWNQL